ncbi:MAG: hypothetical protein HC769_01745 [Cyanobacteria bacterium CRU_2_1]|nr:hypothetical protein [Cyanobacteria bacterium RU_5_0]NJR57686.1 hypothetical protein [Cyanobacteria bacterium CRU_2_1]
MTHSVLTDSIAHIQACLAMANDFSRHTEANQAFIKLKEDLAVDHPVVAEMLSLLWYEMLSARRSASFWEQISNVERQMTEQVAANHIQLQQNYLRLIQEQ